MEPDLYQLQKKLDVYFKQPELLKLAMIHPSYLAEHPEEDQHNQRLEFLGDAVLGAAVAYYIYQHYPEATEGELTKTRAAVVCESSLAGLARELDLGEHIRLGRGEAISGGKERASILADAFESLTAAVFLDQGWQKACSFLWSLFQEEIEKTVQGVSSDYKTFLQEVIQRRGSDRLSYQLISETGPDHNKRFTSGVYLNKKLLGSGSGKSKKESEQQAAKEAVELLRKKS
ncbi:MAG TPA: ribonuclease III [Syntrophaceticus sp.]|jgi:ribonuclease-3|nr:ribonuclease III [Syntrophaceticus schinkii]MDD4261317.1 ribonuclease III [Syntrophaceticus schinkii]MDD4674638.1 ribonuclease III [Syntrophaceticus schinkii]HHY29610.1 ribonuclease III [Syntrophaceticus sp.]